MGKLFKEEPEKGRLHIDSPLMGESLVSKELLQKTEASEYFRMHPDINVIKIGGQSIMDRGGNLEQLTMFCRLGYIPVTYGIPPYGFFEHPAEHGSIPPHRTDCGAFLLAENIGARSLIFLKDERGLFDRDPKKVPASQRDGLKFFDRISACELIELDLDDLIVERPLLTFLQRAKCLKEFQIIDALNHPEHILAALEGKHVGTVVTRD